MSTDLQKKITDLEDELKLKIEKDFSNIENNASVNVYVTPYEGSFVIIAAELMRNGVKPCGIFENKIAGKTKVVEKDEEEYDEYVVVNIDKLNKKDVDTIAKALVDEMRDDLETAIKMGLDQKIRDEDFDFDR